MNLLAAILVVTALLGSATPALAAQTKPAWQQEWEKTLELAKKEGQVTVYISGYEAVLPDFEKEFPAIKVVTVTGRGSQLGQRLLSERRAEKYIADVVSAGANPNYQQFHPAKALDPIKPVLMLPEVTDQTKWYLKRHQYSDPEGQYVFNYVGSATYGAVNYNTKLVDVKEFKSYWDLLNPRWKGKIVAIDPNESAGGWRALYYKPSVGAEFLKRLFADLDITPTREDRQAADWLATGKFALGLFVTGVPEAKAQGLPVDEFRDANFKEPPSLDTGANGTIVLLKQAPHPNAAKVFINWFLSREGQSLYQEVMNTRFDYVESMREDIAKESIPAEYRRRKGVKYVNMFVPEHMDPSPLLKLYKDIMKR